MLYSNKCLISALESNAVLDEIRELGQPLTIRVRKSSDENFHLGPTLSLFSCNSSAIQLALPLRPSFLPFVHPNSSFSKLNGLVKEITESQQSYQFPWFNFRIHLEV